MRDAGHSSFDTGKTARSNLHGYLLASAVVLAGCGSMTEPVEDGANDTPRTAAASFKVALSVTELDESVCRIEVIAATRGGGNGAYAEWRDLKASAYDPNTGEFIGNSRTQQLHPDVFDANRLYAGEEQRGMIDLERFRRDEGEQVMVELEFYYAAVENGEYQERMANITHDCL